MSRVGIRGEGKAMGRPRFSRCNATLLFLPMLLIYAESTATFVANAVTRDDFPPGFIFGAGTSAYQVEGAAAEDGRKPSIWDTFAHAGKNLDKSTADIAADQYHKYKEDVKLMHEIGLNAYRFSISWSRLIPDGRGPVNPKGLEYYNNLINELISYNIEAHVTLHHFDLPQALQDEYEGFLSQRIVEDFTAYADTCFREFGNRVTNWITFNEPNVEPISGYSLGVFPPGRCSYPCGNCYMGDSAREPYVVGHNFLLSHASAAALYKEKYQLMQEGKVGITLMGLWFEPLTNLPGDVAAAKRTEEFILGWFLHPLVYGTYPAHMKEVLGSRLPSFGAEESKFLKASFDFIGITHYNAMYQGEYNTSSTDLRNCLADIYAKLSTSKVQFGKNIFEQVQEFPDLSIITPWSLKKLLEYIKEKYGNPPLIIHENGYGEFNVNKASSGNSTDDERRAYCLQEYTGALLQTIRNGSNTLGYFVWSFVDCFELAYGYTARYGLYEVDFGQADRRRYPRLSAQWYSNFLRSSSLRTSTSSVARANQS